eukprot:s1879_g2.t1
MGSGPCLAPPRTVFGRPFASGPGVTRNPRPRSPSVEARKAFRRLGRCSRQATACRHFADWRRRKRRTSTTRSSFPSASETCRRRFGSSRWLLQRREEDGLAHRAYCASTQVARGVVSSFDVTSFDVI